MIVTISFIASASLPTSLHQALERLEALDLHFGHAGPVALAGSSSG